MTLTQVELNSVDCSVGFNWSISSLVEISFFF